jgi:cobalt-zinc-cadmium efflux system membrane fusion protein
VAESRARLRSARSRARVAESTLARERNLHSSGISSLKEVQSAEQGLEEANAEVSAAQAALGMVGADDGESGAYELRAPIGGVITKRNFTVGTLVGEEDEIFEIIDTSSLWADIDIPESQAARVAPGQRVIFEVDARRLEFEGSIRYVAPTLRQGRSGPAQFANPTGVLRANMYAGAHLRQRRCLCGAGAARSGGRGPSFSFRVVSEFATRRVLSPSDGEPVPSPKA